MQPRQAHERPMESLVPADGAELAGEVRVLSVKGAALAVSLRECRRGLLSAATR